MYPKKVPWATACDAHRASVARSQDPPHLSLYPKSGTAELSFTARMQRAPPVMITI
jgi:hypothetical protein